MIENNTPNKLNLHMIPLPETGFEPEQPRQGIVDTFKLVCARVNCIYGIIVRGYLSDCVHEVPILQLVERLGHVLSEQKHGKQQKRFSRPIAQRIWRLTSIFHQNTLMTKCAHLPLA